MTSFLLLLLALNIIKLPEWQPAIRMFFLGPVEAMQVIVSATIELSIVNEFEDQNFKVQSSLTVTS